MTTSYNFRKHNLKRTAATFLMSDRFENEPMPNRFHNQYVKTTLEDKLENCYKSIIKQTKVDNTNCWNLSRATGIDITPNGYFRVSLNRQKVLTHVLVYLYHHPGEEVEGDVSHLCGNRKCVNPIHLYAERHLTNTSRISCPGTFKPRDPNIGPTIQLCEHTPRCKHTTIYDVQHILGNKSTTI